MKPKLFWLSVLTFVGAYYRFSGLGNNPLWTDEVLFAGFVQEGARQEFVPIWIAQIFGLSGEWGLRSISAFAGTLSIPATFYVLKNNRLGAAAVVALCPLFVFWSRLARPYALAGLFVILGWRWAAFYLPALLTTPVAWAGMKWTRYRQVIIASSLALALLLFFIRPDAGRDWLGAQFIHSMRWFYVPALSVVLHCADYLFPFLRQRYFAERP